LQYGHQVAQKISTVGLPSDTSGNDTVSPWRFTACHFGAISPSSTANAGIDQIITAATSKAMLILTIFFSAPIGSAGLEIALPDLFPYVFDNAGLLRRFFDKR
jgi:hypothetical protein